MKRTRFFTLLLALLLSVSVLCMTAYAESDAWDGRTSEAFADGDGSESDPYQIANGAQLYYLTLQSDTNHYYVLTDDINLGNQPFPIINTFSGVLDGDGHKIINLYITSGTSDCTAMIAACTGTVKNLSIYGTVASTSRYTAAIAGKLSEGTIENCQNYCTVKSTNTSSAYTGGLASYVIEKGIILDCANFGEVSGSTTGGIAGFVQYNVFEYVDDTPSITGCLNTANISGGSTGGICGSQRGTTISECVNTGKIIGTRYAGGITGETYATNCKSDRYDRDDNYIGTSYYQSSSFIHDCYNTGEIAANSFGAGGITGSFTRCHYSDDDGNHSHPNATPMGLENCYNIGKVTQQNSNGYSGDILGYWSADWMLYFMPAPKGCLYLSGINPDVYSKLSDYTKNNGGAECSESQLKDQSFYASYSFDFDSVWEWDPTGTYPYAILKRVGLPINRCNHEYELTENTATCLDAGVATYTCSKCGDSYTENIPATGHTPADAVRENELAATCSAAGSYDEVIYCSVCEEEISRTQKTIEKLPHTPADAVRENEVAATCSAAGSYDEVIYCSVCSEEISRTQKTIEKLQHTPADAVRENEVAATCSAAGSYDEVIYCSVCSEEISRTQKTIEKLPHDFSGNREYCANGCGTKNPNYVPPRRPSHGSQVKPAPTKPEKPKNPFKDVSENDYFYDAVLWAVDKGITSGTSATIFDANKNCTRAEMVTFLWRAAGKPEPTNRMNPFTDVKDDSYYYKAVLWAVENGITKGTSNTTFSPNATCTRGQTATFLYRYAGSPAVSGRNYFNDVNETDYYYDAVVWAASEEITTGTSATTFSPADFCTRGQIVTFLYRYLKN